jgi:hypothetical protein
MTTATRTVATGHELTEESLRVFSQYAKDAGNWSGMPWVSVGNIECTKEMRGNLSDLVQKGLIRIGEDEYSCGRVSSYVDFTATGVELARSMGIEW